MTRRTRRRSFKNGATNFGVSSSSVTKL